LASLSGFCLSGQTKAGTYPEGDSITLSLTCQKVPRELKKGDKLWLFVFSDKDDADYWLMFNVPIPEVTSSGNESKFFHR
jgi:hypothetical protein